MTARAELLAGIAKAAAERERRDTSPFEQVAAVARTLTPHNPAADKATAPGRRLVTGEPLPTNGYV